MKININSLSAFTLTEVMMAAALFGLVVAGTISVFVMSQKLGHSTSLRMQTVRESSLALARMVYGLGTNNGLRAAGTIMVNTNVHGHWTGIEYWKTQDQPPSASSTSHFVCGWNNIGDGSWRLIISNKFSGIKYIDYNQRERNILFWSDIGSMASRLLIGNYVSNARVTTNANGTFRVQLTVAREDGMFSASNTVSSVVKLRNKL
jgi:type II secretory pathway pseudopilin PulG